MSINEHQLELVFLDFLTQLDNKFKFHKDVYKLLFKLL